MLKTQKKIALFATLPLALVALDAFAKPCPKPNQVSGDERTFEVRLFTAAQDRLRDKPRTMLFAFHDEKGSIVNEYYLEVPKDAGVSTVNLPPELFKKKELGLKIRVYHSITTQGYIVPWAESEMKKKFDPRTDCPTAKTDDNYLTYPTGGLACDEIGLKAMTKGTLLFDQSARHCDTYASLKDKLNQSHQLTKQEKAHLQEAVTSFNQTFGGPTRAPAVDTLDIHSGTKKTQEIGTPMKNSDPKAKKVRGGN
jgi:hypothetical protein